MTIPGLVWSSVLLLCAVSLPFAQENVMRAGGTSFALPQAKTREPARDRTEGREVAERFAPIFYQALGDKPRSDYITNFDFDGDWKGNNNWDNLANTDFPLKAYIYFSVAET